MAEEPRARRTGRGEAGAAAPPRSPDAAGKKAAAVEKAPAARKTGATAAKGAARKTPAAAGGGKRTPPPAKKAAATQKRASAPRPQPGAAAPAPRPGTRPRPAPTAARAAERENLAPPPAAMWGDHRTRARPDRDPAAAPPLAAAPTPPPRPPAHAPRPQPHAPEPVVTYRPEPKGRKGLVVAAVIAACALAGGGVGVGLALRDGKPSKAEFIADADEVCRSGNGALSAIGNPTNYPELATAAGTIVAAADAQVSQLRQLERPGGDQAPIDAVLSAIEATGRSAKQVQDAAGAKDDTAATSAARDLRAAYQGAGERGQAYGFTACGTGLQAGAEAVFGGAHSIIKAAFVANADNLCRAGARQLANVPEPRNESGREIGRYFGQALTIVDQLLADLRALPAPPGDEAAVGEMWDAQEKVNAIGRELRDAALAEDLSRFIAAEREISTLTTAADAKLDAYGLGTCGSNFGEP